MDNFGYEGNISQDNDALNVNEENKTDLNGDTNSTDLDNHNNNDNQNENDDNQTNDNNDVSEYEEGTVLEIGDDKYTIDKDGNAIDKDGNIYKQASEVQEWLKSFEEVIEDTDEINIKSIQDILGIEIKDENNKLIEFENTIDGVKSYVNAVIESKRNEHYDVAINTLYQRYPILEDVLNYYLANGNSLKGFGEMPDRSNITIDENNEAQQIYIIKTAWSEKGIKGDVNNYIEYLKSSGILYTTAKEELDSLKQADREYKEQLAQEAERRENEYIKSLEKYWNGVHDIINTRKIAGYQIPENIVITRNGQKLSATPEDFFNYIYRTDNEGLSAYQRDLEKETAESRRDDEILRAYLKFVGGNYSNLVDMAINKQNVNTLKFKAANRTTNKVRVNKPKHAENKNIDLGYN